MKTSRSLMLCALSVLPASAQVFDPNAGGGGGNTTVVNQQPKQQGNSQFLGTDMPFMNPGDEVAQWNGHTWNITNNRLFRGRFEKYLAAPEDDAPADQAYRKVMFEITQALTPKQGQQPSLHRAVGLLQIAADSPIDARLCDTIASAVWTVWMVQRNEKAMEMANQALQKDIKDLSLNVEVGTDPNTLNRHGNTTSGGAGGNRQPPQRNNGTAQQTRNSNPPTNAATSGGGTGNSNPTQGYDRVAWYISQITEKQAMRAANIAKFGINELKSKIEFQGLIIQLFLQRRFEHVLVACRIYNLMFSGQDRELQIKQGSDVEKMFAKGVGINPTISTLEAFASEAIRDVDEGVKAFEYLIEKDEVQTASNRLGEAFAIGEYLPRVRTLPRTKKERVLEFVRDSNMLISSLEVKDYGRAEELLLKLKGKAKDFDDSKPRAAVESARAASGLHIEAAKLAAVNQDSKKVEDEIRQAAELWPTNPEIKKFSQMISTEGNAQTRILMDFESLLAQRNYRQIAKDAPKYAAVMLTKPDKQKQLEEALEVVKKSEKAVITAEELAKANNIPAAWESVQEALVTLPDDTELNKKSAQFSSQVSEFVQALDRAKKLEEKRQVGASLAWFLRAERLYPGSRFARDGIARLSDVILPEGSAAPDNLSLPAPTNASGAPSYFSAPTATPVAPTQAPAPGAAPAPGPTQAVPGTELR